MGYKAAATGNITIDAEQFEGIMALANTRINVTDNVLGTTHNLKEGGYIFSTEAGTFNNRLTITYADSTLSVAPAPAKNNVLIYNKNGNIQIIPSGMAIKAVSIYDLRGRLLYSSFRSRDTELIIPMNKSEQMILVKVVTADDQSVVKKIIY